MHSASHGRKPTWGDQQPGGIEAGSPATARSTHSRHARPGDLRAWSVRAGLSDRGRSAEPAAGRLSGWLRSGAGTRSLRRAGARLQQLLPGQRAVRGSVHRERGPPGRGELFPDVPFPVHSASGYADSDPGRAVLRDNIFVNSGEPEANGTVVEPRTYYSYTLDPAGQVSALVRAGAGVLDDVKGEDLVLIFAEDSDHPAVLPTRTGGALAQVDTAAASLR